MNLLGTITNLIGPVGEIVDNLHTSKEEKLQAKERLTAILATAEQEAQKEVTARWQADTQSDSWLPKNIRPVTLAFLTIMFVVISMFDGNIGGFTVSEEYIPVYEMLLMTVYGAYFVGRTVEKAKKINK